jgi:hypothetical protein
MSVEDFMKYHLGPISFAIIIGLIIYIVVRIGMIVYDF